MPSSSASTEGRLNLARSSSSLPPGKLLILQTSASFSGACVAVPEDARTARQRQRDLDALRRRPLLELRFRLDEVLRPRPADPVDAQLDRDERPDVLRQAVGHEVERAVRWHERDGAVGVEAREADALVELDVLEVDGALASARSAAASSSCRPSLSSARSCSACSSSASPPLRLEEDPIVETEPALRHPGQISPHLERAADLAADGRAGRRDDQIDSLHDVEKNLVLLVFEPVRAPGNGVGDRGGRAPRDLRR